MNDLTKLIVGAAIVGGVFAFLWWRGYLDRLTKYIQATREELYKCTWPSAEELKGNTVVVAVSIALLGVFTVSADFIFVHLLTLIYKMST